MQITEQLLMELSARLRSTDGEASILNAAHATIKQLRPWLSDAAAAEPAAKLRAALLERAAHDANKLGEDRESGDLLDRSDSCTRAHEALRYLGVRDADEIRRHVSEVATRADELKLHGERQPIESESLPIPQSRSVRRITRKAAASDAARITRIARGMAADPIGNLPPAGSGWQHN